LPQRFRCAFLVLPLCFVAAACGRTVRGTVDESKFSAFSKTITELSTAIDDQASELPNLAKDRFRRELIEELQDDDFDGVGCAESRLDQAQLPSIGNTLEFECVPYFMEVRRFRANIKRFMGEMLRYSRLLEKLAAKELTDVESVTKEADAINTGVSGSPKAILPDAANLVDALVKPITDQVLEHLQASIRNQQIDEINKAIVAGQPGIQANVDHLQGAIQHLGRAFKAEQNEQWQLLQPDLHDDDRREATVDAVIAYAENRRRVFESLRNLQAAASKIPEAHEALAIDTQAGGAETFASFIRFATELQSAIKSAEVEDKNDELQAEADKSDALADAAELDAQQTIA